MRPRKEAHWGQAAQLPRRRYGIGTIDAPDEKAPSPKLRKVFGLSEDQRGRLMMWERD